MIMLFRPRPVLSTIQKLHFHTKSKSIVISDHVQNSLLNGEPIVALESTIITHGMPQPHNLNTAKKVESIIREKVCIMRKEKSMRKGHLFVCLFILLLSKAHLDFLKDSDT